jgi:anti-sigma factor RsiW
MNCAEIRPLLHAHADGELDPIRSLEVEQHLKTCSACAAEINSVQSLRSALQNSNLAFRATDSLRRKVWEIARAPDDETPAHPNQSQWFWKWLAAGATAFAVLTILLRPAGNAQRDTLMNEVVASHVRSLMVEHLTDVASSDQHTVKPWFDGKLDFAPDVKDCVAQGFPLVGGRLDYLNGRAVAALVYRHNKHLINVFVWPAANDSTATEQSEKYHGYSVIMRDVGGFHYYLVSDLNETELGQLAGFLGK